MEIPELPFDREAVVDYTTKQKIQAGGLVVDKILEENDSEDIVIGYTGGKDSTLTAYLVKQVCEEKGYDKPRLMVIDHGQHFDEIEKFIDMIAEDWGFEVAYARNDDVIEQAEEVGDVIQKEDLNERNQEELERVGKDQVPFLLDTEAGNHLLKTVAMNEFLENEEIKFVINGVRWDEHDSRADEDFYSSREEPEHIRVHPILQFTEMDVWDALWNHVAPKTTDYDGGLPEDPSDLTGVTKEEVPINPKYWNGFRSLGSETSTDKTGEKPAWLQDFEGSTERAGRAQNKDDEEIMNRLRSLGYMIVFGAVLVA